MYIFMLLFFFPLLFAQRMASEAIRASSFSFASRQVEQAVEYSGAHLSLDKSFFSAVATTSRSGRPVNGEAPDPGRVLDRMPPHILHITGSFAGHEYEAGLVSFLLPLCLLSHEL